MIKVELVQKAPPGCSELLNNALGDDLYWPEYLQDLIDSGTGCVYTVEDNGQLVGVGTALIISEDFEEFEMDESLIGHGFLESAALLPEYQGQGLGRKLAARRMWWLVDHGCRVVLAMSWEHPGPRTSRPVLERLGFEAIKRLEEPWVTVSCPYCGDSCHCPAVIMRKFFEDE